MHTGLHALTSGAKESSDVTHYLIRYSTHKLNIAKCFWFPRLYCCLSWSIGMLV